MDFFRYGLASANFNVTKQSFIYSLFCFFFETTHLHHDKVDYLLAYLPKLFLACFNYLESATLIVETTQLTLQKEKIESWLSPSCRAEGSAAAKMAATNVCVNDRVNGLKWQGTSEYSCLFVVLYTLNVCIDVIYGKYLVFFWLVFVGFQAASREIRQIFPLVHCQAQSRC